MKKALVLFTFLLISSVSYAQSLCPNYNHIFLIHGIGGSGKSFGEMSSYLKNLDECYVISSFEYDTGNSSLSTYDFAVSFQNFLVQKIKAQEISATDKISLIMHSQGGLVGNLWLNLVRDLSPVIYHQVDAFITLSTPHWGAEVANLGRHLFFSLPEGVKNPISPFGSIELNEMSYGSSTIQGLSWMFAQNLRPINFRPLAVGGIHKIKNKLIGENDIVVPVYSSRPDHFIASQIININENQGLISATAFVKTQRIPFVTVAATHLKMDLPGIATIPTKCLNNECNHPSLPVISNHLKGRSIASVPEVFDHFRTSLYLKNETGDPIKTSDVKLEVVDHQNITIPLSQKLALYRGRAELKNGLAFTFHGHTKKSGIQNIRLRIKFKDRFERLVDVPVEGGFASVIHLNLK
jgi:pimeloyl-ACP methyl ester carboxylesterase